MVEKIQNEEKREGAKDRTVAFRVSQSDYEKLQRKVKELDLPCISDLLRSIVREEEIKVKNVFQEDPEKINLLKELNFQIRKIGVNINQIAYGVNLGINVPKNFYTTIEKLLLEMSRNTKYVLSELEKDFEFRVRE